MTIPTKGPSISPEDWLADYRLRREHLNRQIKAVGREMLDIDRQTGLVGNWCSEKARRHAQQRRPGLEHPFCLVLWSRKFDEEFFLEIAEGKDVDAAQGRGLLTQKAENFLPRIGRLTLHLDLAGLYTTLIWPQGREDRPSQPLCLEVPEEKMPPDGGSPDRDLNLWFYVFTAAIDLAQAIVVETNYSRVLYEELTNLRKRGLGGRVLYFDINDELYRVQDDRRWPLESVGAAVEFAAMQPIRLP